MNRPTERQVKAGKDISNLLYDAHLTYALDNDKFDVEEYPDQYRDLILAYVREEISSVEAIYIAMERLR
jgi:hypothetical protein